MENRIVAFGEVLWDLLPQGEHLGGAPLNFAYRLHCLDEPVAMVSRLGRDERGQGAAERVAQLGMATDLLQWDDEHPTGTVEVSFDQGGQPDYVIHANVAYDYIAVEEDLPALAAKTRCFCFGTLAQRSATSRTTCHRLLAEASGALKLLDVNLRKECYTADSVTASLQAANVLKLNDEEVGILARLLNLEASDPAGGMREMMHRYGLELCLMTCGAQGVLGLTPDRVVYRPGFAVEVADPVGSGDAFTAGFCHRYLAGDALADALEFGNAAGAWVASQPGATGPMRPKDVASLIDSNTGRVVGQRWQEMAGED